MNVPQDGSTHLQKNREITAVRIIIIINPLIIIIISLLSFSDLLHTFSHIFIHLIYIWMMWK